MIKDTQKRIEQYKAMLPGVKERIAAVALMLVMSIVMMASASYAWFTISRAPELKGMNTTIAGNGNLEIALVSPDGLTPGDAMGTEMGLLESNITWGNLVNLSDSGYGLDQIALRPALLSGYNRNNTPLYGASYDESGRVNSTSDRYGFATWKQAEDGSWYFDAAAPTFGVRAIASVTYENISGNAAANKLMNNARDAYVTARGTYLDIISNEYLISSPGVYPEVYSMDALSKILQVFVQDKADYYVARLNGTEAADIPPGDFTSVVVYAYRLALAFQELLLQEGAGLLHLANLQAYKSGAESTETFSSLENLLSANAATLASHGIQLESLATYKSDYDNIKKCVEGLANVIENNSLDEFSTGKKITWNKQTDAGPYSYIGSYINYLVDINTTTIAQNRSSDPIAIGSINSDTLMSLLNVLQNCQKPSSPADVVIYKGIISNLEKRLPEATSYTLEGNNTMVAIPLTVHVNVLLIKIDMDNTPVYASVRTTAAEPFISNNDFTTSDSMDSSGGNKGDAVANDTYGMALDLWVRTNVKDVVLTLEGSLVTQMEPEYGVDKNGDSVQLYLLTYEGTTTEAYQLDGYWYDADGHVELGKVEEMTEGCTIEEKQVEVVVGYDGVNRVWEDYLSLIEAGLMAENNTTQGAGSCYVFYADPSDQTRILHLLEAFTVVFVDQEGNTLGTAKLDTEHYYSINGKTTVPLKMVTGQNTYVDENGDDQLGITPLNQNEATWITALVYLDGQRLTNADVLAVGEIEGSLNIQFGSSVSLNNMDDEDLRTEYREITATATSGGSTSSSSAQPISFEYDGNAREVIVTLTVEGEQPKSISAFFVRSISQSQGTRGETVSFTKNSNNTWTATFSLTKPGSYSLRNLIVDGSYYSLYDGTDSEDDIDNFPTVEIEGLGVSSVFCDLPTGITMTADNSVSAYVSASINASEELMPRQVRALFRSTTGREFTALLSYDKTQNNWSGTAQITESGTYTLMYLVMDGQYTLLDEELQTTHIVYLGLTTQVWSDGVQLEDGSFSNTFEFKGAVNLDMQVKIFDGSGNELRALEDVWLYYLNDGSILDQDGMYGKVTWNEDTKFYEGKLELRSGGTFVFNRVVTNKSTDNPSTIRKAAFSPIFLAYVTDPPAYEGHTTEGYQFKPNGGATMSVQMTNAQTATLWAQIKDLTSGEVYMVPCASRGVENVDTNLYSFTFDVPKVNEKQDGEWQLMALYMQGVAKPNPDPDEDPIWVPVSEGEPTEENCYVLNVESASITAYVVQTVNVTITDSTGNAYTGEVFGKDASGNVTGTFMQGYNTPVVTVTVKDWNGRAIEGVTGITWDSSYNNDSATYGGYTGAYEDPAVVNLDGSGTTFTLAAQTLRMAGSYTSKFVVSLGDTTMNITGPSFQVWSVVPTVAITEAKSGSTSSNTAASFTATSTTVYFVESKNTTCGVTTTNYTQPYVNINLTGIGSATNVTLEFAESAGGAVHLYSKGGSGTSSSGQSQFTWTANGVCKRYVGSYTYKSGGSDNRTVAGTLTATQLVLTYNGNSYIVTLSTPITISNPS